MRQKRKKNGQVEGFIFRREWAIAMMELSLRQRGAVAKAMTDYFLTGSETALSSKEEQKVFYMIRRDMDNELAVTFNTDNYD